MFQHLADDYGIEYGVPERQPVDVTVHEGYRRVPVSKTSGGALETIESEVHAGYHETARREQFGKPRRPTPGVEDTPCAGPGHQPRNKRNPALLHLATEVAQILGERHIEGIKLVVGDILSADDGKTPGDICGPLAGIAGQLNHFP
jgi:hypothetical protein